jgi:hypothetical protein
VGVASFAHPAALPQNHSSRLSLKIAPTFSF